jgi:exosortase/archaeosortase family protein
MLMGGLKLGVSQTRSPGESLFLSKIFRSGSFGAPLSLLLALGLTLAVIAADQFAAPILQTTSPLWATAACLLLVWRRGPSASTLSSTPIDPSLSKERLGVFAVAHLVLILIARSLTNTFEPMSGAAGAGGILVAAWKLSVLAPTIVLFPLYQWKKLLSAYGPEGKTVLVVLLTYVPRRALEAAWPWYGQVLGRSVYTLSLIFLTGVGYEGDLNPTVTGPDMDINIVPACSGISGFELFGYLFGFAALLDWNRLRKGRTLLVYCAGFFVMLLGNALRITSFVVLGNRGFMDFVSRFHLSAGSIFFSVIFLVYLSITYGWMLKKGIVPEVAQEK